jgi:L-alanine-DL-glutamate epimerase-like enolase superfamily enzyme
VRITDYTIRKLLMPADRSIGDSQIDPVDSFELAYLELETDSGERGYGFDSVNYATGSTLPPETLRAQFEPVGERLVGESPFALRNRLSRPRGGNYGGGTFDRLVDFALWDLCAKRLDVPVYELMGGGDPTVPAYASGLAFHHDDERTREIYERFAAKGFTSAKVKIGYPTVEEDLERLSLVEDVLGGYDRLMIDANEAFSPKEAVRRTRAYRDAGFDIYWFEDPTFREDVAGIRRVVEALPRTNVNTGEYVDLEGKRELLENGAADILNVHGLTSAREAALLAGVHGVPVSLGNTPAEIGVHSAVALPEVVFMEYSMTGWDRLPETPVTFEDGRAVAPEGPGHGLEFSDEAIAEYEQTG